MVDRLPGRGADQFPLRLPDGHRDWLKSMAAKNKRSMNAEILARLDLYDANVTAMKQFRDELNRMRDERDAAEAKLRQQGPVALDDALKRTLSPSLWKRLEKAASGNNRPVEEELVQALEKAYPPPRPPAELRQIASMLEELIDKRRPDKDSEELRALAQSLRSQADEQEAHPDDQRVSRQKNPDHHGRARG